MLFNSYVFILLFLPVTWVVYHFLNKGRFFISSKTWLVASSVFFLGYWSLRPIPILVASLLINYFLADQILKSNKYKRLIFWLGLIFNIGLLCFFKYADFFLEAINYGPAHIALPLGISYYTVQQIAYITDTYEGATEKNGLLDYTLFVTFFPKLIAGPITHHEELIPQFKSYEKKIFSSRNINLGIYLFVIGLFKKVIIADSLSVWTSEGFKHTESLHLFSAWGTSLAYTFQLYFDFSGYSDMAIGVAKLFNIDLPQNFNSPLIAKSINDFWARWHISLSQFIRSYIFTPLVRLMPSASFGYSMLAMFLAMTIAGIWHGAGWTFAVYGALHGLAIVIHHYWKKKKKKLPTWLGWLITFNFVNISFTIFRATNLVEAKNVLSAMFGINGVQIPKMGIKPLLALKSWGAKIGPYMTNDENLQLIMIIFCFVFIFKGRNSLELESDYTPKTKITLGVAAFFVLCLFGLNRVSEFIYFNF